MDPSIRAVPQRGEIVWLTFNPQAGHEQSGRRPALVVSPGQYNARSSLAIVCPITNSVKGLPFEVRIPTGLPVTGCVLADHVKSLDWHARSAQRICEMPNEVVKEVLDKLGLLLQS